MAEVIEYYFSITSPWAFLGSARLMDLSRKNGIEVKPFIIATILENGWVPLKDKPAVRQKYVFEDMQRWSRRLGVPLKLDGRDKLADASGVYRMPVAAQLAGLPMLPLAIALQTAFWGRGENIGDPAVRAEIARGAGYDADALLAGETAPEVAATLEANIAHAAARGVFGSPTYIFRNERFWGQDRLDFLEEAITPVGA